MKNTFDDTRLTQAAKGLIGNMAEQYSPEKMELKDSSVADNIVDIKTAKAKAGARRRINRTIRICAVAAVLMIGLVCALFMGAEDDNLDPATIQITKEAYMWENNNPDSEWDGLVTVSLDVKKTDELMRDITPNIVDSPVDIGAVYEGSLVITNNDGKIIYETGEIKLEYENQKRNLYYNGLISTTIIRDEETGRYDYRVNHMNWGNIMFNIYFDINMSDFELIMWEKPDLALDKYPERAEKGVGYIRELYSIYAASGATSREEAVAIRYENFKKGIDKTYADEFYTERGNLWN